MAELLSGSPDPFTHTCIVNPRRMREGYGSHSVCLCVCVCVCLSVTALAATYLVYTLKAGYH